jgi:hypothetical protein
MHAISIPVLLMTLVVPLVQAVDVKVPKGLDTVKDHQDFQIRERTAPLLNHPLRQPSICQGDDGWYYLTGTDGVPRTPATPSANDFLDNDGIRVWRSQDLETWQELGKVFDLAAGAATSWWLQPTVDPATVAPIVAHRGVRAPEVHHFGGTFWIVFSINGDGVGILKSTSGTADGPYALTTPATPLIRNGGSPSLFRDEDATYLIWGSGWIARLNADLTGLAEPPTFLGCTRGEANRAYPLGVGQRGFSLFKHQGKYWLTAACTSYRDQITACDVMTACADHIKGPYGYRRWMIPQADETTLFPGPGGKIYATYCGDDENAVFTDRAGVVPLGLFTEQPSQHAITYPVPTLRLALGVHTERGCWHEIATPITNRLIRDCQAMQAPDGWYYFTGSCMDPAYSGKFPVLRSRDLVNWEEHIILTMDQVSWLTDAAKRSHAAHDRKNVVNRFMDSEIHWLNDTFYAIYGIYRPEDRLPDPPAGMMNSGVGYMRSTTGTIDGPWEQLGLLGAAQGSFFQDDDGQVYVCSGQLFLGKMGGDMKGGKQGSWTIIRPQDGSYSFVDVGACIKKVLGRYVYITCGYANMSPSACRVVSTLPQDDDVITSYCYAYMTANNPAGPYSRARLAVAYGGHGSIFQDSRGRWWASFQRNSVNSHFDRFWFDHAPGIVPLEVHEENGELVIRVADHLPEDVATSMRLRVDRLRTTKPMGHP